MRIASFHMEAIIFIGIQGAGKSTFYRERFFDTHVRINLDMLRTRKREEQLLAACLDAGQSFVVDNTNPQASDPARPKDLIRFLRCRSPSRADSSSRKARRSMAQGQEQNARKLTTHQKAVLIQVLRTFPDERVEIRYAPEAEDALWYAQDFLSILKAIGWGVTGPGPAA